MFVITRISLNRGSVPSTSTSTSTSTLFHKTIGYNRLARKIAIASLGGPVKRKINRKEKKGKEKEGKEKEGKLQF